MTMRTGQGRSPAVNCVNTSKRRIPYVVQGFAWRVNADKLL